MNSFVSLGVRLISVGVVVALFFPGVSSQAHTFNGTHYLLYRNPEDKAEPVAVRLQANWFSASPARPFASFNRSQEDDEIDEAGLPEMDGEGQIDPTTPIMLDFKGKVDEYIAKFGKPWQCGKKPADLAREYGYPFEEYEHKVRTADGYLLTMHRLPNPGKPPVLLQHGILDSSITWMAFPDALAYVLFNAGYDVWLGNNRGNTYSHKWHKEGDTSSKVVDPCFYCGGTGLFCGFPSGHWGAKNCYWEHSWQEMGRYDVSAMVDFILEKNGGQKIAYVGHSQGTAQLFAGLTGFGEESKRLSDKISLFVALAPVTYLENTKSKLIRPLIALGIDKLLSGYRGEFLGSNLLFKTMLPALCRHIPFLCEATIYLLVGDHPGNLDPTRFPVYLSNFPAGVSMQSIQHWAQLIRTKNFQAFDYSSTKHSNKDKYGQDYPPQFDFSKFPTTTKVAILAGKQDELANPKDVARLRKELPSSTVVHYEDNDDYGHVDFVWASNAPTLVYPTVLRLIKEHHPTSSMRD